MADPEPGADQADRTAEEIAQDIEIPTGVKLNTPNLRNRLGPLTGAENVNKPVTSRKAVTGWPIS